MEKYERVLKLMQARPDGRIEITDPELIGLLGKLMYRLPTYMYFIRKNCQLDVICHRVGRLAVAYQLGATTVPVMATTSPNE